MEAQNLKSLKLEQDGIFEITLKPSGKKYLIYNKNGVKYFPCPLTFGMLTCDKIFMTYESGSFCIDPKFTDLIENMDKKDADKIQKLTGKKLENLIIEQMKEHEIYCFGNGDNT